MFLPTHTLARLLLCWLIVQSVTASALAYDVYLLAGQSNMDGRGQVSELTADQRQPLEDAIIFYRSTPNSSNGWHPLAPGYSMPPKYRGKLPAPTFGPELGFARAMLKAQPGRKLALIKGSKGGTSLRTLWHPGVPGEQHTQGPCYRDLMETIRIATEELTRRGDSYTLRGLLWHQGVSRSQRQGDSLHAAPHQFRAVDSSVCRIRSTETSRRFNIAA